MSDADKYTALLITGWLMGIGAMLTVGGCSL